VKIAPSDSLSITSEVGLYKINGRKIKKGEYSFTSDSNQNHIETTISVVGNGHELEGRTTIYNPLGDLTYNWVATRK